MQRRSGRCYGSGRRSKRRKLLATSIEDVDMNGLRELGNNLKEKLGEGVIVLASQKDGKVFLVAMVTDEAQKAGAHAGNLIKAIRRMRWRRRWRTSKYGSGRRERIQPEFQKQ